MRVPFNYTHILNLILRFYHFFQLKLYYKKINAFFAVFTILETHNY